MQRAPGPVGFVLVEHDFVSASAGFLRIGRGHNLDEHVAVSNVLAGVGSALSAPKDIHATIHVERESQKPIIIGKGGVRLKAIGTSARVGIEKLLGARVYLNVHVRVAKEWQRDPKQLGRLGF